MTCALCGAPGASRSLSYIPDQTPTAICADRDACNAPDDDANNTTAIFERLRATR